jgi:hypothetical protein
MEKDQLQAGLLEWEGEGGNVGTQTPERMHAPAYAQSSEGGEGAQASEHVQASQLEADRFIDPRHRRGSLAPPRAAPPLGETASASALHAHLAHLLDTKREPVAETAARAEAIPNAQQAQNARNEQIAQMMQVVHIALPAEPDQRLSPHEDVERQPDGVPHLVIGLTALFSVVFAIAMIAVLLSGPSLGSITVAALTIIGFPVLVIRLNAKADRDRDHVHPSR